jgi:nitrate/nitrite transport system substrate-binding protein
MFMKMKKNNLLAKLNLKFLGKLYQYVFLIVLNNVFSQSEPIKLGFIPLTDCAPLVIAKEKGFFQKYGVNVVLSKEASWANVRDKILTGELDGAHCLFGMPFSVYTGVGGKAGSEMRIAMVLSNNGQGITVTKELCGVVGLRDFTKFKEAVKAIQNKKGKVTMAMTFPGGTHDIWLRVLLANTGVDQSKVNIITIPPPQMVANMRVDNMEIFSVGEPWNAVAAATNVGFTFCASQDIWNHHPEKALVLNKNFAEKRRDDLKKVMKAIIEASQYIDNPKNKKEVASIIADSRYVNAKAQLSSLEARLNGKYDIGCDLGVVNYKDNYMLFHNGGKVNMPRKAHGAWFIAQYVRFGYLKEMPSDYKKIVDDIIMDDLYAEVAKEMNIPLPDDDKPFTVTLDKVVFDPDNVQDYLKNIKK